MSDKVTTFDRRTVTHNQLVSLRNQGYRVICPLCNSDILFSNAGSSCSKNRNHYETHIYGGQETMKMRRKWDERRKKKSIANMKKMGYTEAQIQDHLDKYYPENIKER